MTWKHSERDGDESVRQTDAAMQIPDRPLNLGKAEAAIRQVGAAIDALERGDFDVTITLAGAAEDLIDRPGSLFAYHLEHPKAKELGIENKELRDHMNKERDWLKHGSGPDTMEITCYSAAFMIARAVTKLRPECCTPRITAFVRWWCKYIEADNT
jgi:hypothetical protein